MQNMFLKHAELIDRDQRMARALRMLEQHTLDGTETFRTIAIECRGIENAAAETNIRHAVLATYRNTVPVDLVLEILAGLLDSEDVP